MLEHHATSPDIRRAMQKAHTERAHAFQSAWSWLFSGKTSR